MTYRCKIGHGLEHLGIMPTSEPAIYCDGCGLRRSVSSRRCSWVAAKWFLDGRPAPGWTGGRLPDGTREDYCPECSRKRVLEVKP